MKGINHTDRNPTVYVVDDDPGARQAIVWMLESAGRHVQAFDSGEEFLAAYRPERTGCLVLDLRLRGMTGLALQDELVRRGIALPVIMMTGYAEVSAAVEALQRGAIDFIEKPVDDARLLERIETAFALDAERRRRECLRRACAARIERLTRREREVMAMVVAGKANKVVAYELGISHKTVESHRASVMTKLEVQSFADLVRLEWQAGHGELGGDAGFRLANASGRIAPQ
jgi:two-component system response regulator TtrR